MLFYCLSFSLCAFFFFDLFFRPLSLCLSTLFNFSGSCSLLAGRYGVCREFQAPPFAECVVWMFLIMRWWSQRVFVCGRELFEFQHPGWGQGLFGREGTPFGKPIVPQAHAAYYTIWFGWTRLSPLYILLSLTHPFFLNRTGQDKSLRDRLLETWKKSDKQTLQLSQQATCDAHKALSNKRRLPGRSTQPKYCQRSSSTTSLNHWSWVQVVPVHLCTFARDSWVVRQAPYCNLLRTLIDISFTASDLNV